MRSKDPTKNLRKGLRAFSKGMRSFADSAQFLSETADRFAAAWQKSMGKMCDEIATDPAKAVEVFYPDESPLAKAIRISKMEKHEV